MTNSFFVPDLDLDLDRLELPMRRFLPPEAFVLPPDSLPLLKCISSISCCTFVHYLHVVSYLDLKVTTFGALAYAGRLFVPFFYNSVAVEMFSNF